MQHQPERRAFLRGRINRPLEMRPPGSLTPEAFEVTCTKCGDCLDACPQEIILFDSEGLPKVDLTAGACLFCDLCADACLPGAIEPAKGWDWRAKVDGTCLSANGVMCRTCEDTCDAQAIRFRLQVGGSSKAQFNSDACTGCGACAAACPTNSISFYVPKQQSEAETC